MRLIILAVAVVLGLPFQALGQQPAAYVIPSVPAPRDPLPRFTIAPRGGSLAPIGLPLPPVGLQPPANSSEPMRHRHRHGSVFVPWPRHPNAAAALGAPPIMVFYVPQPFAAPAPPPEPASKPIDQPAPPGRLVLDIQPATAQVFADGYYVGVPEDFSAARGGGILEAGVHRIDISAAGYEPRAVDLRVAAGQSVTYRAALKALPPPAAVPPSTFYLIPGCYIGNIPPKDAHLPASCDQNRAITWRP